MAIPPIKKTLSLPINDAVNPPSKDPKGAAMLVKLAIKEKTLPINSSGSTLCKMDMKMTFVTPMDT